MRTMLISLILFCSLTQFAIADDPPAAVPAVDERLKGCGSVFECYMPEVCTSTDPNIAGKSVDKGSVVKVISTTQVFNDCPALIRFHLFTESWVHVSIESFKENLKTKSIKFFQDRTVRPIGHMNEFSCEYGVTEKDPENKLRSKHFTKIKNEELPANNNTFVCTFEVTVKPDIPVFRVHLEDEISFEVDGVKTKVVKEKIDANTKCDPSEIEYTIEDGKKKYMYEKIQYTPGKISCENPDKYKMQVRKPDEEYKTAEIECVNGKYKINNEDPVPKVNARCAAEVKYLCDYDVKKTSGGTSPKRTTPNVASNIPSAMECEGKEYIYLIVQDIEEPLINPKFECKYYGGSEPFWTVTAGNKSQILTKDGPEVQCTKKVECHKLFMIADSSVEQGELNAQFLPECSDRGTLFVKGKKVTDKRCDEETSKFMYTDADGDHVIDAQTRFVCNYPTVTNEAKNAENAKKIAYTTIAVGVGSVLFIGLLVAGFCVFTCFRIKKERKKLEKLNQAAWLKYCATAAEKAEYMKKNNIQPQSSGGEPAPFWNWNSMIMFLQHTVLCIFGLNESSGEVLTEELKNSIELPLVGNDKEAEAKVARDFEPYVAQDEPMMDCCELREKSSWWSLAKNKVEEERKKKMANKK